MLRYQGNSSSQMTYEDQNPIKGVQPGSLPQEIVQADLERYKIASKTAVFTRDPDRARRCNNVMRDVIQNTVYHQKSSEAEAREIAAYERNQLADSAAKRKLIRSMMKKGEVTEEAGLKAM